MGTKGSQLLLEALACTWHMTAPMNEQFSFAVDEYLLYKGREMETFTIESPPWPVMAMRGNMHIFNESCNKDQGRLQS